MMPTVLTTKAVEKSTYIVTASFTDEDGNAATPNALTWTLTDGSGNVVNERSDVVIAPSSSVEIVLQGDDLATTLSSVRYLTLEGNYDSDAGSNLPIKDEVRITIEDLEAVT
jgi:hypothetical protein